MAYRRLGVKMVKMGGQDDDDDDDDDSGGTSIFVVDSKCTCYCNRRAHIYIHNHITYVYTGVDVWSN